MGGNMLHVSVRYILVCGKTKGVSNVWHPSERAKERGERFRDGQRAFCEYVCLPRAEVDGGSDGSRGVWALVWRVACVRRVISRHACHVPLCGEMCLA